MDNSSCRSVRGRRELETSPSKLTSTKLLRISDDSKSIGIESSLATMSLSTTFRSFPYSGFHLYKSGCSNNEGNHVRCLPIPSSKPSLTTDCGKAESPKVRLISNVLPRKVPITIISSGETESAFKNYNARIASKNGHINKKERPSGGSKFQSLLSSRRTLLSFSPIFSSERCPPSRYQHNPKCIFRLKEQTLTQPSENLLNVFAKTYHRHDFDPSIERSVMNCRHMDSSSKLSNSKTKTRSSPEHNNFTHSKELPCNQDAEENDDEDEEIKNSCIRYTSTLASSVNSRATPNSSSTVLTADPFLLNSCDHCSVVRPLLRDEDGIDYARGEENGCECDKAENDFFLLTPSTKIPDVTDQSDFQTPGTHRRHFLDPRRRFSSSHEGKTTNFRHKCGNWKNFPRYRRCSMEQAGGHCHIGKLPLQFPYVNDMTTNMAECGKRKAKDINRQVFLPTSQVNTAHQPVSPAEPTTGSITTKACLLNNTFDSQAMSVSPIELRSTACSHLYLNRGAYVSFSSVADVVALPADNLQSSSWSFPGKRPKFTSSPMSTARLQLPLFVD